MNAQSELARVRYVNGGQELENREMLILFNFSRYTGFLLLNLNSNLNSGAGFKMKLKISQSYTF
jgi:hypothetical protein